MENKSKTSRDCEYLQANLSIHCISILNTDSSYGYRDSMIIKEAHRSAFRNFKFNQIKTSISFRCPKYLVLFYCNSKVTDVTDVQ